MTLPPARRHNSRERCQEEGRRRSPEITDRHQDFWNNTQNLRVPAPETQVGDLIRAEAPKHLALQLWEGVRCPHVSSEYALLSVLPVFPAVELLWWTLMWVLTGVPGGANISIA